MSRALMVGGVFLLSRDPASLAEWYSRHLGWQLEHLEDGSYYAVLPSPQDDGSDRALQVVFAIMPGDPGAGDGHITNDRVDDIEAIVDGLHRAGIETSAVTQGADGEGEGTFARLQVPEGHRIELWQHLES